MLLAFVVVSAQEEETTLVKAGEKAPLFTCKTIDGKTIDLAKLKGKVIMINFFATWCGPCNQELPVLQKNIWEKYRNNPDFVLIVLGREHTEQEVIDFAKKKNLDLPFAPDVERKIFSLYAKSSIPRNVIIDKKGVIVLHEIGYTPEAFQEIEDMLAGMLKK